MLTQEPQRESLLALALAHSPRPPARSLPQQETATRRFSSIAHQLRARVRSNSLEKLRRLSVGRSQEVSP